jgi:fido (protein-threonine AMPylation protein)
MNHAVPPAIAAPLKNLRSALAIIHCRRLLSTFQKEAERTISHDQAKRVTYLTELFSRIHREAFRDWKEQASARQRPGVMSDADQRKRFRETVERLVLSDDNHRDTAVFDNNGFVIHTGNIAERLADFYHRMRVIRPFAYGNKLTLDFFMIALGNLPAFISVYEHSIDFRRLDAADALALHDRGSSLAAVALAFRHALDPLRNRGLENRANGYGKWPEQKTFVYGIPFLRHRTADGRDCLVTVSGGLVPLEEIKEESFPLGEHFADYPLPLGANVIGYLPGTENLRQPGKTDIDGIPLGPNGEAPLFCLDVNMMSGLRSPSHTELMVLLQECAGEKATIQALVNNPVLKNQMLAAADGDLRLRRAVEIAYERLGRIFGKLELAKQAIFEGKTPSADPKLFLCMGGAGAGKTAVEEIAQARCGDNFVIASLDEFRKKSDLYMVLTAANHHSDDYIYVEPFANTLRDQVAAHARDHRVNLLYDGTSIPYIPRYSGIVESFKSAGFQTFIAAVDSFIVKPRGREEELSRSAAIGSVRDRFEKTGRALPWVVAVDKHIRAPGAFLYALEHAALDKISLFANDGERDRHYLVAESFDFSEQELEKLKDSQLNGLLAQELESLVRQHPDSTLRHLAGGAEDALDALLARNPSFTEANVAYLVHGGGGAYCVLLVYNVRRLVDFLEKGQLNPNASGEEGLLYKHASLAFHVNPKTGEPWNIRLQDSASEAVSHDKWFREQVEQGIKEADDPNTLWLSNDEAEARAAERRARWLARGRAEGEA